MRSVVGLVLPALLMSLLATRVLAESEQNLSDLSLEELFNVEVVSVSKKPEHRSEVAAALSVISQEDLRRSGATNLPDALRLVPGTHVARINASQWVVSIRGFSNRFSNKLLVLNDGRSIYTPLYAGVFWDVQNPFMDDLDRIEVVRGPGGTLWGANAVNGVVNLISKSAKETQGGLVYGSGGTEERAAAGARYGGKIGEDGYYRVYGRYFERDGGYNPATRDLDRWWMGQGGFRTDLRTTHRDSFTLQGDAYGGETAPFGTGPDARRDQVGGANLLGRWKHAFSDTSESAIQVYYDTTNREDDYFRQRRHTFDFDAQHRFRPLSGHDVVWGAGVRVSGDRFEGSEQVELSRDRRTVKWFSAFVQDEISLIDEILRLSLGTKLEYNDFTQFEFQPSARLAWTVTADQTAWAAVSRAIRVPSRVENDLVIQERRPALGLTQSYTGSNDSVSEELLAYEIGYRVKPLSWMFFDVTGFLHDYDRLITFSGGRPVAGPGGTSIVPIGITNAMDGETYGAEFSATLALSDTVQLRANYSYLEVRIQPPPGSFDPQGTDGSSPENQLSLWSRFDLPWQVEADAGIWYVDSLSRPRVHSYVDMDVRLGRHFGEHCELSVVGHNLIQAHHLEFTGGTEVQRGMYVRAGVTF